MSEFVREWFYETNKNYNIIINNSIVINLIITNEDKELNENEIFIEIN